MAGDGVNPVGHVEDRMHAHFDGGLPCLAPEVTEEAPWSRRWSDWSQGSSCLGRRTVKLHRKTFSRDTSKSNLPKNRAKYLLTRRVNTFDTCNAGNFPPKCKVCKVDQVRLIPAHGRRRRGQMMAWTDTRTHERRLPTQTAPSRAVRKRSNRPAER